MRFILDATILLVIIAASLAALGDPHDHYIFAQSWDPTFAEVLPHTAVAALKIWTFWAIAAAVIAALLLRLDPGLGMLDATLGGFIGVWVFAYVGGNLLGPIGFLRPWTLWTLLALGVLWAWRRRPPAITGHAPPAGLRLALLALALVLPTLLALQLGSPVAPHMDVLATPAAAQRILTFGRYLPFANDPYGYWDAASQCPGLELLYALLALGGGTSLGVLAQTTAIVPMAGLLILSTYRLGRTIGGDLTGGVAGLLLFATVMFRVMPNTMHGRVVTFVLVGAGLAFFLDERRNQTRLVLGALALSTAVASHAIMGTFGMAVASVATIPFWLLNGNLAGASAATGVMMGATLIALPTVAVGLRVEVPYPALPAVQILGLALVVVAARALHERAIPERFVARWLRWGLACAVLVVLIRQPPTFGVLHNLAPRFPLLLVGACLGLGFVLLRYLRRPSPVLLTPVTIGLLVGMAADYASARWWTTFANPKIQTAVEDFSHKVDYWYPYVLVFPTACLGAWLYRSVSPRLTVFALLAVLFFPWKDSTGNPDPNYHQHSIAEAWAFQLQLAKGGYWGSTGHRRWAQSPAEMELVAVLRGEIAAGRITPATHITYLTPYILLYNDNLLFPVYTGINGDGYVAGYQFDRSIAGGRLRPAEEVEDALARRPPYVALLEVTVDGRKLYDAMPELPAEALQGYEEIFHRDGVRLLRDRALPPPPARATG